MYRDLLTDATFHQLLLACDRDLADTARDAGCERCNGVVHSAHYCASRVAGPAAYKLPWLQREFGWTNRDALNWSVRAVSQFENFSDLS